MPHQLGGHLSRKAPPRRFVVLDRDGTSNVERHYLTDPVQLEILSGAAEGLRRIQAVGLGMIVITNQSGIGRGLLDWACSISFINDWMSSWRRKGCTSMVAMSVLIDWRRTVRVESRRPA